MKKSKTLNVSNDHYGKELRQGLLIELSIKDYDVVEVNGTQAVLMNEWNDITYEYIETEGDDYLNGERRVIWSTIFGNIRIEIV